MKSQQLTGSGSKQTAIIILIFLSLSAAICYTTSWPIVLESLHKRRECKHPTGERYKPDEIIVLSKTRRMVVRHLKCHTCGKTFTKIRYFYQRWD